LGHPLKRPAAKSRSLKRRPGAAKPELKEQEVRCGLHGRGCTDFGALTQQSCVRLLLRGGLEEIIAPEANTPVIPAEAGIQVVGQAISV